MACIDTTTGQSLPLSRVIFNKYDKDRSGTISTAELRSLVYDKGYYLSDEELAIAATEIDSDGTGSISYEEFQAWWTTSDRFTKLQLDETQLEAVKYLTEYFQYFDADKSGVLSKDEFESLHKSLVDAGYALQHVASCIEYVDKSGDGQINFNEFLHWMISMGALVPAAAAE